MKFNRNRRRWRVSIAFNILFLSSVIEGQQQLDCNFDQKSFCNWSNGINGVEDDFDWQIDNSVAIDGFHSIPRTIEGSGFFTFAQGRFRPFESDAARAWLRSPTIDGTSRPATLSFVFWKTAVPPVLQICTRDAGDNRLRCLDTISGMGEQRWTQRVISIPGNASPFQIVFVATGFRTALDLVGIDDVTFRYGEQVNLALSLPRRPVFLDSAVDKNWQYQRVPNTPADVVENDSQFIFPTPPVAFETYRPIYNRVQNTFDQESYSNSDSTYLRSGDKLFEKPSFNVHQIPTGRPEVFYVTQSKEYENSHKESSPESTDADYLKSHEKSTMYTHTEVTGYTHTEPTMYTHTEPHYYVTTSHAYSSTASVEEGSHFYLTTAGSKTKGHVEPEAESIEPCAAVNCFFDTNMCFWYNDLKANFDWKLKAEGSSTRGIISDTSDRGSYAFVNGDTRKREQRAALRSPTLQVPNGAFLDFTTFVSDSTTGHLSLKSSDIYGDKVLWETFGYKTLGGHGWNRVRVALPNIKYPLMLILEVNQIATGQFIGLDDLRLTDQSGDDVQCSFNSSMYGTTTGTYSMESQYGKEFYHRSKHTTSPVLHSPILLNNVETRLSSFDSNGKYINGEVSVDVLGEHGGSIIKPEIIDASLTTEQVLSRNSDFHAKQASDFRRLENSWPQEIIRLRRFENLVDRRNLPTYVGDIEETDFPLQSYQRTTTSKSLTSILSTSAVPYSQSDNASVDLLGVKDFVRRVGSDLTTLLGINRQSYIFGADVFNRIPQSTNARRNDERNWFRSIFGKKK